LTIFDRIASQYKLQKPFVVYRKPSENVISGYFQKTKEVFFVDDFTETGFVFSPFDNQEKAILIPAEKSVYFRESLIFEAPLSFAKNKRFVADESAKTHHLELVNKAIEEIKRKQFQKVVVSRREIVPLSNFMLLESFKKLLQIYPNAFGYIWFHPKIGLWMGATPETLLSLSEDRFKTMSLAGTQVYNGSTVVSWQSGKLLRGASNLKTLLNALHPTPAVCGFPRLQTKKFILERENYQRTFYTGFLGELNVGRESIDSKDSSLFVNLRCMEIKNNTAFLYVGGGITKDSIAQKEWEETVSKSAVMKAIL